MDKAKYSFTTKDQVKIFRVIDGDTLQRYKTIDWQDVYLDETYYAVWTTQFNNVYTPGYYVAIAYIGGKHYYSKTFVVNQ
ncbi:TPA: DUF5065 family protein [Bacillus pseudomycoides]|nr:DUF5065 family protein [Bacillus pseudomycoides]